MNPDLIELVSYLTTRPTSPVAWPSAAPTAGDSDTAWRAEVAQLRTQHDTLALEFTRLSPPLPVSDAPDDLVVSFERVPVGDGAWQGAKVYRPTSAGADLPALLVLHGGGWWMGGGTVAFELGDPLCRYLAGELGAVVVNFDYRLAPEFPFPTPLDDAEAAVRWIARSADLLGVDPSRIGALGISAGGNLAAALGRRLRRTDLALAVQVLHVAALDLGFGSRSCLAAGAAMRDLGDLMRGYYVQGDTSVRDPEVSPLLADEHDSLPPAVVVVGTHDALRDDGVAYDAKLRAAGVESTLLEYEMTHGVAAADVTARWLPDVVAQVAVHLERGGGSSAETVPAALGGLPVELLQALAMPEADLSVDMRRDVIREQLALVHRELVEPGPEVSSVQDVDLDGLALRVYHPLRPVDGGTSPAFVFAHGGGWWQGWIDTDVVDTTCRERCAGAGVVVVSVGYRKAPEHPYPAPLDDVMTALRWVHDSAEQLGVDVTRVGVGGQSAGANLAAAAVVRSVAEGGPAIAMQLLESAPLDLTFSQPAMLLTSGPDLAGVQECVDFYVPDPARLQDADVSPLAAEDLTGLPPTHVMTGGLDAIRDDGAAYAARLRQCGVETTWSHYPGHLHASPMFTRLLPSARAWRDEAVAVIRALLA